MPEMLWVVVIYLFLVLHIMLFYAHIIFINFHLMYTWIVPLYKLINDLALNIFIHIFWLSYVHSSTEYITKKETAGHRACLLFNCSKYSQTVFQTTSNMYISLSTAREFHLLYNLDIFLNPIQNCYFHISLFFSNFSHFLDF